MAYQRTEGLVLGTGSTTPRSLSDRMADVVDVRDFGVVGDGVTDDTSALQAALTAAVSRNRGRVTIPSNCKIYVGGGNITIPDGVSLIGTYDTMGEFVNGGNTTARDYHNAGSSIILGSAYSIRPGNRCKIQNLLVISKPVYDLMPCTNSSAAAAIVSAFAGTGVYVYAAYDVQIDRCMFLGFTNGVQSINNYLQNGQGTCERGRVTHCLFDCTNCLDWTWGTDFCYFESLHAWNFVTSHIGGLTGAYRTGTAFRMGQRCDWAVMLNCSCYGWNRGFANDGAHATMFIGCKADNNGQNSNSVGFDISDYTDPLTSTAYKPNLVSLVGCRHAAHTVGVRVNTTDTAYPAITISDFASWGSPSKHMQFIEGHVMVTNAAMQSGTTGVEVQGTADSVSLVNIWFKDVTTNISNSASSGILSQFNVRDYTVGTTTNDIPGLKTTSGYSDQHLVMGSYHLWVDGSGRLRIKSSAPASDTDGTIVGTQS